MDQTTSDDVQRGLDKISTRLRNVELPIYRPSEKNQVSILGNRLAALESSINRSLPSILAILDNIQHRLNSIEAGTLQSNRETHRPEYQQK